MSWVSRSIKQAFWFEYTEPISPVVFFKTESQIGSVGHDLSNINIACY